MRLAFFASGDGTESGFVRIADGLARRGYRPCIVTIGSVASLFEQTKLPVYTLNARDWRDPRVLVRLTAILRDVKPHVLITFGFDATVLGRVAALPANVQCVISTLHRAGEDSFWRHVGLRATDPLARLTVATTPRIAETLAARGIVSRRRLRVIASVLPSSADCVPDASVRARYHIADDEFVWLSVGPLDRDRDYATLLDACAWLDDRIERWRLLIAGEGRERATIEGRRDRLGLNDRVLFLGNPGDVERLLPVADAFVLSTVREGAPNALIQAMLAGRPCLATAVGGIPDLIEPGVTGWLVPPRRPDRLADRMFEIMQMPAERRAAIGAAARAFAASAFDVHRVIDEWEDLLADAARRRLRSIAPAMAARGALRARH